MFNDDDLELDYDVPELGSDEDEELEEEEYVERGVSEIHEDEEYERKVEEEMYYDGFPELEDIYNEGRNIDEIPVGYNPEQEFLFKKGVKGIKEINAKYGCNLSFGAIINELDNDYKGFQKKLPKNSNMLDSMSYTLWHKAESCAIQMELRKAYTDTPTKAIESDLKQNFAEICKVIRLYVRIHPEKFPLQEGQFGRNFTDVSVKNCIFNTKGKLRSVFKMNGIPKFRADDYASTLKDITPKIDYRYFGTKVNPRDTKSYILNKVNEIIGDPQAINSQGDRVKKLAECVRLLRPLQAKRENRNIFEFFTNHKLYVAERDTLRACKENMKRLGLSREEISKVLHGGAFNSVKFNDGMTVYSKQLHPEAKDYIQTEELLNSGELFKVDLEPEKVALKDETVLNEHRNSIEVNEAFENSFEEYVNEVDDEVVEFNPFITEEEEIPVVNEDYIKIDNKKNNKIL